MTLEQIIIGAEWATTLVEFQAGNLLVAIESARKAASALECTHCWSKTFTILYFLYNNISYSVLLSGTLESKWRCLAIVKIIQIGPRYGGKNLDLSVRLRSSGRGQFSVSFYFTHIPKRTPSLFRRVSEYRIMPLIVTMKFWIELLSAFWPWYLTFLLPLFSITLILMSFILLISGVAPQIVLLMKFLIVYQSPWVFNSNSAWRSRPPWCTSRWKATVIMALGHSAPRFWTWSWRMPFSIALI